MTIKRHRIKRQDPTSRYHSDAGTSAGEANPHRRAMVAWRRPCVIHEFSVRITEGTFLKITGRMCQKPGITKEITFVTPEDETGMINLILPPT